MVYINEIIEFVESKSDQDKKTLNILQTEEDILLLKAYVKKINLDDNIRVKELNRILSVQDLLVMWLRFRAKFTITDISEIMSKTEDKTRSIIGNALLNITQVDLTAQSDKCFFTSAKMPFYLSTEGNIVKNLSVSLQITKHIKECKYCSSNLKLFKESINKISKLALLEPDNTEYVLYNKKKKGFFSKIMISILIIFVISGVFISPDIKLPKNITEPIKAQFDNLLGNIKTNTKNFINNKPDIKTEKIIPKPVKQAKINNKTNLDTKKEKSEFTQKRINEKYLITKKSTTNKPKIPITANFNNQVVKFVLPKKQAYISNKIINILKKYNAKHIGTMNWGSNLNNGKYYHFLIKNTDFNKLKIDLKKIANFNILEKENSTNYTIPKNYRRSVIWISNR